MPALLRRGHVLAFACFALVTLSFGVAGPSLCVPAIARDLHLNYARQGLLFSASMWAFMVPLLVATVADRIPFRRLLVLASAVQAGGWLALSRAHAFGPACLASVLVGIGTSLSDPLLTPIVCAVYPERRARMTNFLHAFYCVGLILTALLLLSLGAAGATWRGMCCVMGLLSLTYGAAALTIVLPAQAHQGSRRQSTRALLRDPAFAGLLLAMVMAGAAEMGPTNWLPSYVQSLTGAAAAPGAAAQISLSGAAGLVVFASLMGAGRFLTSALAHRLGVRRLLANAAALCAASLALGSLPLGPWGVAACLSLSGFGVACFWPTLLATAGDRFPSAGASMFAVLTSAGCIGCAAAPAIVGGIAQAGGSLALGMAALVVAPVTVLLAARRLSKS